MVRLAVLALLALSACDNVSRKFSWVRLELDGVLLGECSDAKLGALLDGTTPGGFRLDCTSPKWEARFIYDTTTRNDGTVKHMAFYLGVLPTEPAAFEALHPLLRQDQSLTMLPAINANDPEVPPCESARALKRTTGEAPVPKDWRGALVPGAYTFALSKPCGQLLLKVGNQ